MTVKPETLEVDFKTAAIGTLVAGQWFARNADTSRVDQGEYPLLLVTGGVLHQVCSWSCTDARRNADIYSTHIPHMLHFQQLSPHLRISLPTCLMFCQNNSMSKLGSP